LKDSQVAEGNIVEVAEGNPRLFFAKSPEKITQVKLAPSLMHERGGNHEII
jgi:hypothetical protein